MDWLVQLAADYTMRTVALGAGMLGLVCGALGSFAVLRGQSLVGDAMAHAALPGIALAFLLTGTKTSLILLIGAALAGWIATLAVMAITRTTRVKYESALGLVLAVFFGFGLMLLTFIQRQPNANQAGLESYLFGQAAALLQQDLLIMVSVGAVLLLVLAAGWNTFTLLAFDAEFGRTIGFRMNRVDVLLTTMLVIAIVIGLQMVGVILMSALLIAPAAAARQWTNRLGRMTLLSALFGAIGGISGAVLSSQQAALPTGPMIVICVSIFVVISLLFAPNRGLLFQWFRNRSNSRRLRLEAVLLDLYVLSLQHQDRFHPHHRSVLDLMNKTLGSTEHNLGRLKQQGLVNQVDTHHWSLTTAGANRAEIVLRQNVPFPSDHTEFTPKVNHEDDQPS